MTDSNTNVERHGTGRKRPPFGTKIAAILEDPTRLRTYACCTPARASIWIATGPHAWDWQREHPRHLAAVLPDGMDPGACDWRWLVGHEPALLIGDAARDTHRRRQIAACLFRDGVKKLLAGRLLIVAVAPGEVIA